MSYYNNLNAKNVNLSARLGRKRFEFPVRTRRPGLVIALFAVAMVLLFLLGIAWLAFLVWALVTNIIDINTVGPNFWNVLWVVLSSIGILGAVSGLFRRGA